MKRLIHLLSIASLLIVVHLGFTPTTYAQTNEAPSRQDEIVVGRVQKVLDTKHAVLETNRHYIQTLRVDVTLHSGVKKTIQISSGYIPYAREALYGPGDEVLLGYQSQGLVEEYWYMIGHRRTPILWLVAAVFVILTVVVARAQGARSLLAMLVTGAVMIYGVLPQLYAGTNPQLVLGGAIITLLPVSFYLSHGVSTKTNVAIFTCAIILGFAVATTQLLVQHLHLTGLTSDELLALLSVREDRLQLGSMVAAGIVLGVLGVLDDVSITQASIVHELYDSDRKIAPLTLFSRAMNVGQDHIASVVNTLILVYAGSSLSTLLLITQFPRPLTVLLNSEVVATQLLITLVGSISLIIAIPLTTAVAVFVYCRDSQKKQ